MERPPRDPRGSLLTQPLLIRVCAVAGLEFVAVLGIFEWELALGASVAAAQTAALNALVAAQWVYVRAGRALAVPCWRMRPEDNPALAGGLALTVLLQVLYTYVPGLHALLGSAALGVGSWIRIVLAAGVVLAAAEAVKARTRKEVTGLCATAQVRGAPCERRYRGS